MTQTARDVARNEYLDAVRRFNRFYTTQIGVLREQYSSPYSLTEVRLLYELAHREKPTASDLAKELRLDAGYLSRLLRAFEKKGLLARTPSESDGRQNLLSLTARGRVEFGKLNSRTQEEIGAMLGRLPAEDQRRLVAAMETIATVLGDQKEPKVPYLLRSHRPGDMGWVVYRHGVLYAQEYGWDERFEALVAEIVGKFIQQFDPKHERCWIAEREGEIAGSVFLVKKSNTVAKLRLLYVEPKARGLGIGARLVEECIRFARQVGYQRITLWTQSNLEAARHIYRKSGFELVASEPHKDFGFDLVSETWELKL